MEYNFKLTKPFGPGIAELTMPKETVDGLNNYVDNLIKDKEKSKKLDAGATLVGQVTQELSVEKEVADKYFTKFISSAIQQFVFHAESNKKISNIKMHNTWIVRQFSGEYNPVHYHSGHISGVGYLKVPENLGDTVQTSKNLNVNGHLNVIHGSRMFTCFDQMKFKPEVGKFIIFPHYLLHTVYPFYAKGERRSISFNASVDQEIYNVHGKIPGQKKF